MFIYRLILQGFKNFIQEIKEILFFRSCLDLVLKLEMIINRPLISLKKTMVRLVMTQMRLKKMPMESNPVKENQIKIKIKSKFMVKSMRKKRNLLI